MQDKSPLRAARRWTTCGVVTLTPQASVAVVGAVVDAVLVFFLAVCLPRFSLAHSSPYLSPSALSLPLSSLLSDSQYRPLHTPSSRHRSGTTNTMDASELGRWTRFAAKGGIGKCTALQDCIAEQPEDLMFLKVGSSTCTAISSPRASLSTPVYAQSVAFCELVP